MDIVETFGRKYLEDRGIPFLGAIPQNKALASVSVAQVAEEMQGRVIAGQEFLSNRYDRVLIGAMSAREAMDRLSGNVLLVTPGDRDDMLLAAIGTNLLGEEEMRYSLAGVVITGGIMPHATVVSLLPKVGVPTILTQGHSAEVFTQVSHVVPKIHAADRQRIFRIQTLVRQHVDTTRLMEIVKMHEAPAPA
jgi:BioD-like phosphotransacetylase family protein